MNRHHLNLYLNKEIYGIEYLQHKNIDNILDLLCYLALTLLLIMLLIIILSTILLDEQNKKTNNNKKIK